MVVARLEVGKPLSGVIYAAVRLALARYRHINRLIGSTRNPLVFEVKGKIVADADRIDSHYRELLSESVEELNYPATGVLGSQPAARSPTLRSPNVQPGMEALARYSRCALNPAAVGKLSSTMAAARLYHSNPRLVLSRR